MVHEDLTPSRIMTPEAFKNTIVVNSAIGGPTNAPIHLNAIARHLGLSLTNDDWQTIGLDIPLLANLQPAGEIPWRGLFSRWRCARSGQRTYERRPVTAPRSADRQRENNW